MRYRVVGLTLVAAAVLGCAHAPVAAPPLPAAISAHLGAVGVGRPAMPSFSVEAQPLRGALRGAGKGATTAFVGTLAVAFHGGGDPRGAAALVMMSPGIALIGAVVGAAVAPSEAAVVKAEKALAEVMAEPGLAEDLQQRVAAKAQSRGDRQVVMLPELPAPPFDVADCRGDLAPGVDTILQMDPPRVALAKTKHAGGINPALQLTLRVTTTLLQAGSGEVFYTVLSEYLGEAKTFTDWGENGARALRDALALAAESVAEHVVGQVFTERAAP